MTYLITLGLIALFLLGIPIAMSLGLISVIAFFVEQGSRMNIPIIAQRMMSGINNFVLLAVPLFILSARLMNTSGVTTRLFNFATTMVGFLPGGLGHANCLASLIFAGMSGAARGPPARGPCRRAARGAGTWAGTGARAVASRGSRGG